MALKLDLFYWNEDPLDNDNNDNNRITWIQRMTKTMYSNP
jgi:hypothetical protein